MTFEEIIRNVDDDDVLTRMIELYPHETDNIAGYRETIARLRVLESIPGGMRIVLTNVPPDEDGELASVDVSGKDGTLNRETHPFPLITDEEERWAANEASMAIEFVPWNQWLGMEIDRDTVESFSPIDIVVHCLWEMTFADFDQNEIHDKIESIREMVRDYKARHPDEEKNKTQGTQISEGPPAEDVQKNDDPGEAQRPS